MKLGEKESSENRRRIAVFPTLESPISNSLNKKSYDFFAILRFFNFLLLVYGPHSCQVFALVDIIFRYNGVHKFHPISIGTLNIESLK